MFSSWLQAPEWQSRRQKQWQRHSGHRAAGAGWLLDTDWKDDEKVVNWKETAWNTLCMPLLLQDEKMEYVT